MLKMFVSPISFLGGNFKVMVAAWWEKMLGESVITSDQGREDLRFGGPWRDCLPSLFLSRL